MQLLEKHFEAVFAAPDGVEKLRELIVTFAIQGRLVPQDLSDQPASDLLNDIEADKQRLVKEKIIKKPKKAADIQKDELPYELPDSWEWVRIRDIGHDWGQKKPDKPFAYIDVGTVDNKSGKVGAEIQVIEPSDAPSRARKIVRKDTVIYSTVRPYLLNIAIVDREHAHELIASTAFAIINPYEGIHNKFVTTQALHLAFNNAENAISSG